MELEKFVGENTRRSVLDDEGSEIGFCLGEIIKFVPAQKSNVLSKTGKPVALWQVQPLEYCLYEPMAATEYPAR